MSILRPTTPVVVSDASSDGGSLSDLDSSWTDLETNRSNGRHSPSFTSEAGESEDARSVIDQCNGEAWEGLIPEHDEQIGKQDVDDNTLHVDSSAAVPSHASLRVTEASGATLENWVADAIGSSILSDDDASTPHMSFHTSSSRLRLSFPDPLSNSDHDPLPSHSLPQINSRSTEGSHSMRSHSRTRTESLSSVTAHSASATTASDNSFSVSDESEEQGREVVHQTPVVELVPPADSYALSILLLGHPPLPHLKRSILSTIIDMVATVLDGSPRIPEGSDTARIHEVLVYSRQSKSASGSESTSPHSIIIEDRTSGMSPSSSFTTLRCPTLALVFIQPPLSSPSLPSLPWNTRYIPLLLPSIADCFAASLLDVSPSVLFEKSVPDMPISNNMAMKSFASAQCAEMNMNGSRLDGSKEVLTVEEFSGLPMHEISSGLRELLCPFKETSKEDPELDKIPGNFRSLGRISTFRKQIALISAFLLAILFGSTVFLRGTPSSTSSPDPQDPSPSQGQRLWSFLHPPINRTPNAQASSSCTASGSSESSSPPLSLIPASLKSLAVSVFLPDSGQTQVVSAPPGSTTRSVMAMGRGKEKQAVGIQDVRHGVRPATIDPAVPHLTIDAPFPKSLSILPQTHFPERVNSKERVIEVSPDAYNPSPGSTTSLCIRISNALAPLFDRVHTDIQEIQEAIDALLRAIWRLQRQTAHDLGEFVRTLSAHWQSESVQELVRRAAQTVSERATRRHARARRNARKIRDISGRFVSAAGQKLLKSVDRARGNARRVKHGLPFGMSEYRSVREHRRTRASTRRKRNVRRSEGVFESVMALVA